VNLREELQKPGAFPYSVELVELKETHISQVFLAGEFVYKIKKPVKFSFLDFSTLENRKKFCELEIELNSRLSPQLYLGVVPVADRDGVIGFESTGKLVEYAVKMNRLPSENQMDLLLKENKVSENQIIELAEIIAEFHSRIPIVKDKKFFSPEHVQSLFNDISTVRDVVEEETGKGEDIDHLIECSNAFIEKNSSLLRERQEKGFIKECHADLHSGNIFLMEKPVVFDCVEFNDEFRFTDTGADVAFMAMDLDAFDRSDFAEKFIQSYVEKSSDEQILNLLQFYKCYRANVRAKVAGLRLMQGLGDEKDAVLDELNRYLALALQYSELF